MNPRIDWGDIDLVVFDVDGTLYDAARLRRAMLGRLLADAWQARSLHTLRVLRAFRQVRESLAEEGGEGFLSAQYARTAARVRCGEDEVRLLAREWMEHRPLPLLQACRRPRVDAVFCALRRSGKRVAVLSDYPAVRKLRALGLRADLVVSAGDPSVGRLKPDPRGLQVILQRTGVPPSRALMIGDRVDRDGAAAQRAGMRALVLHAGTGARAIGFRGFDDPVFEPLFGEPALVAA